MREKLMSAERQQELVESVKTAATLHNEGLSPTEAIVKVATEKEYNEHEAKLMVDAFNTSRTLAHMQSAEGVEKAASFDLASYEDVYDQLYAVEEKTASVRVEAYDLDMVGDHRDANSGYGELVQKVAYEVIEHQEGMPATDGADVSAKSDLHHLHSRKAYEAIDYWRKKADEHRNEAEGHKFHLTDACQKIASHFSMAAHFAGWSTFCKEAEDVHGEVGKTLAAAIGKDFGLDAIAKRHGAKVAAVTLADTDSTMHKLLKVAVLSAEFAADEQAEEEKFRAKHAEQLEEWRRLGKSGAEGEKTADFATMATVGMLNKALQGAVDAQPQNKPADISLSPDVGLESEYGKARLQLAVQDMMENDEVIGQHADEDPATIMQTVKELSEVQPNILNQPMTLRSALRRQLELGTTEPHELEQVKRVAEPTVQQQVAFMDPAAMGGA